MSLRNETPDVSIIIPIYKAVGRIDLALASIEQQELPRPYRAEIILIDDGSNNPILTSKLLDWRRRLGGSEWLTLTLLSFIRNEGQSIARNYALKHVKAPLICYLDADDVFLKGRLIKLIESFQLNPKAEVVISQVEWEANINNKRVTGIIDYAGFRGKETKPENYGKIHLLASIAHTKELSDRLFNKYGHIFVPALVNKEDVVFIRRLLTESKAIAYCFYGPLSKVSLYGGSQKYNQRPPGSGKGFLLPPNDSVGIFLDTADLNTIDYIVPIKVTHKTCITCRERKPLDEFGFWNSSPDLRKDECLVCRRVSVS